MLNYKVKIGLVPIRRDCTPRPGLFNWEKTEARCRKVVKYIEEHFTDDNVSFAEVAAREFSPEEIFREVTFIEDVSFDLGGRSARYVRVRLQGAGPCPESHVRPGQTPKIYLDEIIIE